MKKILILAAAAGMLCAVSLQAQEVNPEAPAFPEPLSDSLAAATRTQEMVEALSLTPEQEVPVFNLNLQYSNLLNRRPERPEGERPDFQSMTEAEREAFFQKIVFDKEVMANLFDFVSDDFGSFFLFVKPDQELQIFLGNEFVSFLLCDLHHLFFL